MRLSTPRSLLAAVFAAGISFVAAAPQALAIDRDDIVLTQLGENYAAVFPIPDKDKWMRAHFQGDGKQEALLEFIPKGQSLDSWNEMITLYYVRPEEPVTSAKLVSMLKTAGEKACPGLQWQILGDEQRGDFSVLTLISECPKAEYSGQAERTAYRYVIGKDIMVNLQRAQRGTSLPLLTSDWMQWVNVFTVCDRNTISPEQCAEFLINSQQQAAK